jgi:hypothetical protein
VDGLGGNDRRVVIRLRILQSASFPSGRKIWRNSTRSRRCVSTCRSEPVHFNNVVQHYPVFFFVVHPCSSAPRARALSNWLYAIRSLHRPGVHRHLRHAETSWPLARAAHDRGAGRLVAEFRAVYTISLEERGDVEMCLLSIAYGSRQGG